jgi:dihydrofolate reductase
MSRRHGAGGHLLEEPVSRIVVINHLTLDGVMQAPGRPDEDLRGGFEHGGWAQSRNDAVMGGVMGKGMAKTGALLFGRRTYEDFAGFWPRQPEPNPFTASLNNMQKYVVSTTLAEPLPWVNSTLLKGDGAEAVARLKQQPGDDLLIFGSGELVRSLMRRNLVDDYVLLIHPLILGSGRRLFTDGAFAELRLVDSVTTTTGVVIATYQPAVPAAATTAAPAATTADDPAVSRDTR